MRKFALLAGLAGMLLTLGGCADSPTSPDRQQRTPELASGGDPVLDQQVQGCVTDGLCILEPIIVDPGCDPWLSLDWCSGGGNCMTSVGDPTDPEGATTVQGCPGTGGGGSGGGGYTPPPGGDPGTICPTAATSTCPTEPEPKIIDTWDDMIDSQERLPDCSNTATWTKAWHGPYCNGRVPAGSVLTAYNAEINAMLAKGGMCAELAQLGQMLLSRGMVRYYTSTGTTAKSWGGSGIGLIMDDSYIVNQPPYDHGFALAHELEHAYSGYVHPADGSDRDPNGVSRTPNDWCG